MIDMRLYYRDHRPYRAERELQNDNAADFRADYWEFYDARGHVVRIGYDYDHDRHADRWDRVDRIAPVQVTNANAQTTPTTPDDGTTATPSGGTQPASAPAPTTAPAP
jgi:hypothetical protein